eukprot:7465211-Pyramimonas_sp.AAC.1
MDLEEYEKEHDEMIAKLMPLPLDMELKAPVERDKSGTLRAARKWPKGEPSPVGCPRRTYTDGTRTHNHIEGF